MNSLDTLSNVEKLCYCTTFATDNSSKATKYALSFELSGTFSSPFNFGEMKESVRKRLTNQ